MSNMCFIVRSFVFLMDCPLSEFFFPMNTADSNVENMNISNMTECLSLSFVAFFEGCFCLSCTWSFTCARMIWILATILILLRWQNSSHRFSITNCSAWYDHTTGLPVQSYFLVCGLRRLWLSCLIFRRLYDAEENSTTGVLSVHRAIKFIKTKSNCRVFDELHPTSPWFDSWRTSRSTTECPVLSYISTDFDFHNFFPPDFLMQNMTESREPLQSDSSLVLTLLVTLSSPDSFCVLFDITSEQSAELKWLMLDKNKRWVHSSRVKFLLVNECATCFCVSKICDLDFLVHIDSIEQQIKSDSIDSKSMFHYRTSSLYHHFDHCFVVFKHKQQSFLLQKSDVWGNKINIILNIDHSSKLVTHVIFFTTNNRIVPFYRGSELCFQGLELSDPINREREYRLISIGHPKRWFWILLNCVKLKFVSCTSNLLEQMYDFQKCTMFLQKWILNLQDLTAKSESWNSPYLHWLPA